MSVKYFCRLAVTLHWPMIHGCLGNKCNHVLWYPLPENDIICHCVGFHLALHLNIKYLESFLGFQSNHFTCRIHDGWVCTNGSSDWICWVRHVDDDHLGSLPHLLPHADELVTLHGEGVEPDVGCLDSNICELKWVESLNESQCSFNHAWPFPSRWNTHINYEICTIL